MDISVVLPVYNEEGNLEPLYTEIEEVMEENFDEWEVVFVDDGSTDSSLEVLEKLAENPEVKVLEFKANFGQTQALQAGLDKASGDIVVTMDSDMQNNPRDIPRLVEKLEESGCDVVVGWRKKRNDPFFKKVSSLLAAKMRQFALGTDLHDYGCTLKAYTKEAADELSMTGEMHRYIPPILARRGYRTEEIVVDHRERHAGETKYSWDRLPKGFMDMVNVWFWQRYEGRPLHVFGGLGILAGITGVLGGTYAIYLKVFQNVSLSDTALPLFAVLMTMLGVQFFISGILADISIKNYHRQGKNYRIERVIE